MWNESIVNFATSQGAKTIFSNFTNKEVPFCFKGTSFSFCLSRSLFSSYDIDAGSKLLLKTIAKRVDLQNIQTIIDSGCGVGVLGLCLLAHSKKEAKLLCEDRNGLALIYTYANAIKNKIDVNQIQLGWNLFLQNPNMPLADIFVANIPAKAGNNLIKLFFQKVTTWVKPESGVVCIVIVKPLSELALQSVAEANLRICYKEETSDYLVLHLKSAVKLQKEFIGLENYTRSINEYTLQEVKYTLSSVYNLPDFDTLSYSSLQLSQLVLATNLFKGVKNNSSKFTIGFINPVQGHLTLFTLAALLKQNPKFDFSKLEIYLYGLDYLELYITNKNIQDFAQKNGINILVTTKLLFTLGKEELDSFVFNPIPTPLPHEIEFVLGSLSKLKEKHALLFSAKSSDFSQMEKLLKGYSMVRHKKGRGFKAAYLVKK